MTARINSPDPSEVDAAADLLSPGDDPELGILIAARQERLRGGVAVVEWALMWAGEFPFGWRRQVTPVAEYTFRLGVTGPDATYISPIKVWDSYSENEAWDDLLGKAWATEYTERPRL